MRSAEEVVGWLDANVELHSLAKADQPVEVGACLIADAIESSTEAPAQLAGVQAALDDLAAQVRVHGPGSTPQELLDQINQVGGLQPYVVERATACSRACNRMASALQPYVAPFLCLQGALLGGHRPAR